MWTFENCSSFCCQGGTRCIMREHGGSKSHTSNSFRVRTPTTAYTNIHQHHNSCWNIYQCDQETEITIDGDEIFLASWLSFAELFQILLPARSITTSRLPYKGPRRPTTHPYAPLLLTQKNANSVITRSSTCCMARVYWNTMWSLYQRYPDT